MLQQGFGPKGVAKQLAALALALDVHPSVAWVAFWPLPNA